MNMEQYISTNWKSIRQKVRQVCKNHQNFDDLLQDLTMTLLEKPEEYQMDLINKKKVEHWFTSSAKIQFNSSTSPYYYKYRRFLDKSTELPEWLDYNDDVEDNTKFQYIIEFIKKELNSYTVYERILASEHILGNKSFSEISKEYGINRRYVSETITPVKNKIIEKAKREWNSYLTLEY